MKTHILCLIAIVLFSVHTTAQQITSVSPATTARGVNLDIIITASDVDFTQGTSMVQLSQGSTQITSYNTTSQGANTLHANFNITASVPPGPYNLSVSLFEQSLELSRLDAISITAGQDTPQLTALSVQEAHQGDEVAITISASNTHFTDNAPMVSLVNNHTNKSISSQSVTTNSSEELEAVFKFTYAHDIGLYSLKQFNALDGHLLLPDAFTLLAGDAAPEIVSVSPESVRQGETIDVEITTTSINLYQGTNLISLSNDDANIESNYYTVMDVNTVKANFSFNIDHPTGVYDLFLKHESGIELSHMEVFSLAPGLTNPSLTSSTPNEGKQGEEVSITIYGVNTHFNKNQVNNEIYLHSNGISINPKKVEVIDNTTISALFDLHYGHPEGAYTLYLYNAYDGTHWLSDAFNVLEGDNIPKITSVSPNVLLLGATLDVEITGENIDFSQGSNMIMLTRDNTTIYMNSTETVSPSVVNANFTISYGHPTGDYILSIINDSFDANIITDKTLIKRNAFFLKSATTDLAGESLVKAHTWLSQDKKQLFTNESFDALQLFNMKGQLLRDVTNTNKMSIASLPPGYYILKMWKNKVFSTEKLVIPE